MTEDRSGQKPGDVNEIRARSRVTFKILNDVKPDIYFRSGTHMSSLAVAVEVLASWTGGMEKKAEQGKKKEK